MKGECTNTVFPTQFHQQSSTNTVDQQTQLHQNSFTNTIPTIQIHKYNIHPSNAIQSQDQADLRT